MCRASVILAPTTSADLDYVVAAEAAEQNAPFINAWSRAQHLRALDQPDIAHRIVKATTRPVGFVIIAGLLNTSHIVEFRRLVITAPRCGFGRAAVRAVTQPVFGEYSGEVLWLDVKRNNTRARMLYSTEGFIEQETHPTGSEMPPEAETLIIMSKNRRAQDA
jgi:diamine N-acetyltransferase